MIEAANICKTYNDNIILNEFSMNIYDGDFISITGESGTGKTTLLNILGLLEKPNKGDIIIDGNKNPNKKEKMMIQRNLFGYVFQNYALIENETVESNLKIALEYKACKDKKEEINKALAYVGLESFLKRKVYELSGGEQQRIALARVILKDCNYIFADEPTGNLDVKNRDIVFELLEKLNNRGKSVIYVTHDTAFAAKANRQINLT